jgi:hypothetical protein
MCNVFFSYTTYFYVLTKPGCGTKSAIAHNELIINEKGDKNAQSHFRRGMARYDHDPADR